MKNSISKISSPEKIFVIIALFFGLLTIFITPIFTGADEESHFIRAWGISKGELFLSSKDGNKVTMPKSFRTTIGCLQNKIATQGNVYEYKYVNYGKKLPQTTDCALAIKVDVNDSERILASSASYSPVAYIPQVVALYIGQMLNMPIFVMGYMVRVAVLVAYIAFIYFAIRLLKTRQWSLVGVALLPHSMMQITNPGADYILFGATAVFVAAIIRSRQLTQSEYQKEKTKLLAIAAIMATLVIMPKGIFPGICLLPLLLFFRGVKHDLVPKIGIIIFAFMVGLIWQKIASATLPQTPGPSLLSLIVSFPESFIKTMFYEWANRDFLYKNIGLGILNKVGLPGIAISLMNMLVAFYIFVGIQSESKQLSHKYFAWSAWISAVAIVVGSFAAMHVMAYVLQSGDGIINGVQPRYFYPALFMLAIIPMWRFIYVKSEAVYRNIVIVGSLFIMTIHTMAIIVRYYL